MNTKVITLQTVGLNVLTGQKFKMDQIVVTWYPHTVVMRDNFAFGCDTEGTIWKHNLDRGISKRILAF